jgi:hypothetical protein
MALMEVYTRMASNLSVDEQDDISVNFPAAPTTIEAATTWRRVSPARNEGAISPAISRESGDEVNRFLLCALVSESAKQIKRRAERAGERLPMTIIVRGVLRSYRAAARESRETLAGSELDIEKLRELNDRVLKQEVIRHTRERVENAKARLERANRLGDEARIKAERAALEGAIAARDHLSTQFR